MGNVCGGPGDDGEATQTSKRLDTALFKEQTADKQMIKLLLLGSGECGKSTILKQMKILHCNGFSVDEKKHALDLVYKNTLESIQTLCNACMNLGIPFGNEDNQKRAEEICRQSRPEQEQLLGLKETIKALWNDPGVRKASARSNEFHLLDSAPYFLNNIERTFAVDYLPTEQDILRTRLATTGIIETDFVVDKLNFKMFDVGGQRGERKKWIHCFEKVRAILFIASLSEYDQMLAEDRTRNRMVESLALFEGIISLPWFSNTSIILFLNKNDLFQEKILKTDLGIYFNSYVGGLSYEDGLNFIKELYFSKNQNSAKTIYCHVTDATDTDHIRFVWRATKHIVMQANLTRAGLMV